MTGHEPEEKPRNPASLLPRPLIRRHKTLARVLLYSAPAVLMLAGYGLIRMVDLARSLQVAWTEMDYSEIESVQLFQEYLRYDTTYPDGNEIEAAE